MKTYTQFFEDIEQRRQQLKQKQLKQVSAYNQRSTNHQVAQQERQKAATDREELKKEIKQELQTEQHPKMEPNKFNELIARRQVTQKSSQIKHVHQEIGAEARAQQAQKRAEMKAILSRD